ncbi:MULTISPECIES: hypothetical protein [Mycolicibacter]|nr:MULTISPECIES: hypothetical protein [Mycolicibacter]UVI51759.1 hypothetical protein MJO54_23615 [Mycolicibacter virginiensis]
MAGESATTVHKAREATPEGAAAAERPSGALPNTGWHLHGA